MKKQTRTKPVIATRALRALAPIDLSEAKGGGVSTSPTGPLPANPCGN
jgi:hypothetical protein